MGVTLYHGSKEDIKGAIAPISRDKCDFGKGFYMGTDKRQPLTLICNYPHAMLYTLQLELSGLRILNLEVGIQWAMVVAYNRGKMEDYRDSPLYIHLQKLMQRYNLIKGYSANDRMFVVLDRFFNGDITDIALVHSLSALQLGEQYVAITKKACEQVRIMAVDTVSEQDKCVLKKESESNRLEGISLAEKICRTYRREGRYFDEIIEAGELYET